MINMFGQGETHMNIIRINADDILVLKKKHPCGCDSFKVMRLGSDIKIRCMGCGHDVTLPRLSLEKSIKKVMTQNNEGEQNG